MGKKKLTQQEEEILRKEWLEYRNTVSENKNKSQDDFEKYINLLASGGLVFSLTFLEKFYSINKIHYLFLVAVGMLLLVTTLLSNLYSHYKSMLDSDSTIKEIDEEKFDLIFQNIDSRNKNINCLNKISIWSLIIGIVFILTFVCINIFHMNNSNNPNRPTQPPKPATEEKGRTTPPPPQKPSSQPKK